MPSIDAGQEWRSFILTVAKVRLNTFLVLLRRGVDFWLNEIKQKAQTESIPVKKVEISYVFGTRSSCDFLWHTSNFLYLFTANYNAEAARD